MFKPNRLKLTHVAFSAFCALVLSSCAESPTGRPQLMLFDNTQVSKMGIQTFEELKTKTPISKDKKTNQYVQCVAQAVLKATPQKYQANPWEIVVFESDQVNAFALPGGKIGVYTGLLLVAENQHQLAAVIGHEIAHVMAGHSNERLSSNQAISATLSVADVALSAMNTQYKAELSSAFGLGAQVGLVLPFSRVHETEADVIGLDLMAKAGFEPEQSVKLWQNMAKQGSGGTPQILSSHPVPENRIKKLQQQMPAALTAYQARQAQGALPRCNK
ncbi:MAG: M48 family metallopeptidase [Gammaproteobacteria bacterium]|jgi:predicted Zn-dependent protease|nr:M48 family metallopeptidase [Gammaproteobacteria bacterium]